MIFINLYQVHHILRMSRFRRVIQTAQCSLSARFISHSKMFFRRPFYKALKFLFGIFLLSSYVIPQEGVLLDINFVYEWSHRQALIAEGSQVISKPNFPDEIDAEDSTEDYLWEDFQSACDCIESNCVHEKMAEKDLEALEKKLYEQERADVLNGNDPFQFDEINEMEETMPKEKAEKESKDSNMKGKALPRRPSIKRLTYVSPAVIHSELRTTRCCTGDCLKFVPFEVVIKKREEFWLKKTVTQQRNFILQALEGSCPGRNGRRFFNVQCSKTICRKAWCVVYGIRDTRYKDTVKLFKEGVKNIDSQPYRSKSMSYDGAKRWMKKFAFMSDVMPTTGMQNLPSCLSKHSVYMLYRQEMKLKQSTAKPICRQHFVNVMWKREFPRVVIPKQSRFTKCAICVHLKNTLLNARLEIEKKIRYTNMRKVHLLQQMAERQKYYKHGLKAAVEPDKYLSIILDGMDQNKTHLPNFIEKTKADENLAKLPTHVTGVLLNARSSAYCYIDAKEYPHDSNLTLNVLLDVLVREQNKRKGLPKTLYLQMDNCGRENKNKYVFSFLALLVHFGIFKKIKIGFLMVGHTHEDVDQLFSRISKRLSKNNACTVDELSSQIKESYNPEVNVISLRHLFNITPWLEPLFNDFSGHSDPHQFKLEKGANGEVNFSYKKWSTRKVWKTGEDGYFPILKSDVDLSKLKPPGTVQVSLEKVGIQKLSTDISKYKLRFSSQTQNWWRSYIEDLTQRQAHSDQYRGEWLLDTLVRSNQDIQQSIPITLLTAEEQKELEDLERMYNKERTEKEVKLKGKRKSGGRKRKSPINAGTATKPRLGKRKNACNNKGKPKNAKRKKT